MFKLFSTFLFIVFLTACGQESEPTTETTLKNEDNKTIQHSDNSLNASAKNKITEQAVVETTETSILKGYETQQVAEHTYVIHGPLQQPNKINKGYMNNLGFIVSDTAVAVIDPGSSVFTGRALVKRIQAITDKPVTHVFNSHVHGDHWLGNQGILEAWPEAKIYAHPKLIEKANQGEAESWIELMLRLTEGATEGTKAVIATEVLTDGQEIKIGTETAGLTIRTYLSEKAHTITDAMFEILEDKVLFTGDNVTAKRLPRMDDGSFRGSIADIKKALSFDLEKVVPGHGLTGDKKVLQDYHDYLSTIYNNATELLEEGLESFEMKAIIVEKLPHYKTWVGFDEEVGKHISLATLEAEQASFE